MSDAISVPKTGDEIEAMVNEAIAATREQLDPDWQRQFGSIYESYARSLFGIPE